MQSIIEYLLEQLFKKMIIHVYEPTSNPEEEVDDFYDQVWSEVSRTCKQNVLLVTEMSKLEILKKKM